MIRAGVGAAGLVLCASQALFAQGKIEITIDRAELERGEQGVAFVVAGAVPAVPDRANVRVRLKLGDAGLNHLVEVTGGRFTARIGPVRRRVLPATYDVVATIDSSLQRVDVAPALSGREVVAGTKTIQVGTPEEAAKEREKLRRRYTMMLEELRALRGAVDMWGTSTTLRSVQARMGNPREMPEKVRGPIEREWTRFTDTDYTPNIAAMRFDHQQLGEFVLLSYFPDLDAILTELMSTLDRLHAGFTVAIWNNLGLKPTTEQLAKGAFPLAELRTAVNGLAQQAYAALGLKPIEWRMIDMSTPESADDVQGDLFHSTISKFEVRKPSTWTFDLRASNPLMRIRLYPPQAELAGKIVVCGVEIHDHPLADSFDELAQLDEAVTRGTHRGFELKKVKKLAPADPTMPHGVRPGQELRFTTVMGDSKRFSIIQHSLFCRWHKRTYSLLFITEDGMEKGWEETFQAIAKTFKVLDAPQVHEEQGPEQGGR